MTAPTLNDSAWRMADRLAADADALRLGVESVGGARVLDCGVKAAGGLAAGLALARVCLADRGDVRLTPGGELPGPHVQVWTDEPAEACMASQYAGWQISVGKYFAMGSGPMRAAYGKEDLFDRIGRRETPSCAVGCLETRKLPTPEVVEFLAGKLSLAADRLTLLAAPTASLAGTLQVVARSVETALHKLDELKFDLNQVVSGHGVAPLPPPAENDLAAIGRTNDAILYGGDVTLWVRCDDALLAEVGPRVPSNSSPAYGEPFAEVFRRAGNDFYKIDPMLFSPAVVRFHNLASGRTHTFGRLAPDVVRRSFFTA
jgi:methenyltetrahydromethanopterin cyclohydrolase